MCALLHRKPQLCNNLVIFPAAIILRTLCEAYMDSLPTFASWQKEEVWLTSPVTLPRREQLRSKSMESLADSEGEQAKKTAVFYDNDPDSPKKSTQRSQTPDLSRNRKNRAPEAGMKHSPSAPDGFGLPADDFYKQGSPQAHSPLTRPRDGSLSRVSYEGSSRTDHQVRYMGGYGSMRKSSGSHPMEPDSRPNPEQSPVRLVPLEHSPTLPRRHVEPRFRRRDAGSTYSASPDSDSAYSGSLANQSGSYSPSSSPSLRRKTNELLNGNSPLYPHSVESSPDYQPKQQKKTAVVSPLLDISEPRSRSVPPDLLMFDPTDPESQRFEQVRQTPTLPGWVSRPYCVARLIRLPPLPGVSRKVALDFYEVDLRRGKPARLGWRAADGWASLHEVVTSHQALLCVAVHIVPVRDVALRSYRGRAMRCSRAQLSAVGRQLEQFKLNCASYTWVSSLLTNERAPDHIVSTWERS